MEINDRIIVTFRKKGGMKMKASEANRVGGSYHLVLAAGGCFQRPSYCSFPEDGNSDSHLDAQAEASV